MADRQFQVLHDAHGTFPLLIDGVGLLAPDGAAAILSASEARRLRDALNAALDVHNREHGLTEARARLDRLNGLAPRSPATGAIASDALGRSPLIADAPIVPDGDAMTLADRFALRRRVGLPHSGEHGVGDDAC